MKLLSVFRSRRGRYSRLALLALLLGASGQPQEQPAHVQANEAAAELVYEGQPLVVPLQCQSEHLMGAGLVCNEDSPCELFLELIDVAAAGAKLYVIGNIHSTAATVSSMLLASEDGGRSWSEPDDRMGAAGFELIQFVDRDHGWIGGQQWDVDTSSAPFLLATVNGGRRWDRLNVWSNFDDRSGALLDFYFDSPKHGLLVVDRLVSEGDPYELYETMNGGRSWSIRQISQDRITIPRGRAAPLESEWRIEENENTGTYDIETSQGSTTFTAVARFAAGVGVCRSMDTGAEEPMVSESTPPEPAEAPPAEQDAEEESTEEAPSGVFRIPK